MGPPPWDPLHGTSSMGPLLGNLPRRGHTSRAHRPWGPSMGPLVQATPCRANRPMVALAACGRPPVGPRPCSPSRCTRAQRQVKSSQIESSRVKWGLVYAPHQCSSMLHAQRHAPNATRPPARAHRHTRMRRFSRCHARLLQMSCLPPVRAPLPLDPSLKPHGTPPLHPSPAMYNDLRGQVRAPLPDSPWDPSLTPHGSPPSHPMGAVPRATQCASADPVRPNPDPELTPTQQQHWCMGGGFDYPPSSTNLESRCGHLFSALSPSLSQRSTPQAQDSTTRPPPPPTSHAT